MAVVIPSTVQLNYKKYSTVIDIRTLQVNAAGDGLAPIGQLTFPEAPGWISIKNISPNGTNNFNFDLEVRKDTANAIAAGTYSQVISVYGIVNAYTQNQQAVYLGNFRVTLNLADTVVLSLNPSDANFQHVLGAAAPALRTLAITSESSWVATKDKSWITISKTSGNGNSTLNFGVNVSGLNVGTYTGKVTVVDGLFTRVLDIVLQVTGEQTPVVYLNVLPTAVQMVEPFGGDAQEIKELLIDATANWTVVSDQPWAVLSAAAGVAGTTTLTLTANTTGLAIGNYTALLTFLQGNLQKTVSVVLSVRTNTAFGINSDQLYFADDINRLTVSNTRANTFAVLDVVAEHEDGTEVYTFSAPYYKGLATLEIGVETINLLHPTPINASLATNVFIPFYPVTLGMKLLEKDLATNALVPQNSFSAVRFINGRTPAVANRLCYLPAAVHTVKNGVLALSFRALAAVTQYTLTGAINQTVALVLPFKADYLYTIRLNLADFALSAGDQFTLAIADQSVVVNILEDGTEHTVLAFENEWQLPEYFMCREFLTIDAGKDHDTAVGITDRMVHTRTIRARVEEEYEVRTGFIRSQEEREWLAKIIQSRRVYIFIKGQPIEVILKSSKLEVYETRKHLISYRLRLQKALV